MIPNAQRNGFHFRIDLPVPPYPDAPTDPASSKSRPTMPPNPEPSQAPWLPPSFPASFTDSHITNEPPFSLDPSLFDETFDMPIMQSEAIQDDNCMRNFAYSQQELTMNSIPDSSWSSLEVSAAAASQPMDSRQSSQASVASSSSMPTLARSPSPSPRNDDAKGSNIFASQHSGAAHTKRSCFHCKTTTTPLWRRGKNQSELLCNACGLYLQARGEYRPQRLIDEDRAGIVLPGPVIDDGRQCSHCYTCRTTVWRRDKEGRPLCNACGVYLKMKGKERPIEFRKDKIRRRQYRRMAGDDPQPDL